MARSWSNLASWAIGAVFISILISYINAQPHEGQLGKKFSINFLTASIHFSQIQLNNDYGLLWPKKIRTEKFS